MAPSKPLGLTYRNVFLQSWPIMLANAAAPIVGLVDTLIIGRFSSTTALAGIGLGAVIYGIAYWGFGFLRMSTAGLAAQSFGAERNDEVQAHLARAVPLGMLIGLGIFVMQLPLINGALFIFSGTPDVEISASIYIKARIWGLPATLSSIALMGWFVGVSRSGLALKMQLALNAVNVILSPIFVIQYGWGLWGVGIASAIAEWCGLIVGLCLAYSEINKRGGLIKTALSVNNLLDAPSIKKLGVTNSNIFIRTMCLTLGFSFFGNAAAAQGIIFLASYHILMQFITMIALVLDAFAHTAEAFVGAAYGAKNLQNFDRSVKLTTNFSIIFAFMLSFIIFIFGPSAIEILSTDENVISTANRYLPYCALTPVIGFAAWQLDGVFIGTTSTREMRNAGILAVIIYILAHYLITLKLEKDGIWISFLIYYLARAFTLSYYYPSVRKRIYSSS